MKERYQGLPAAPGIGIGNLFIYRSQRLQMESAVIEYASDAEAEWQIFLEAKAQVDEELVALASAQNTLVAEVFSAQRVILQDQTLLQAIHEAVYTENQSALSATRHVICELAELFRNLGDDYFAGRSVDILDIGQRLLAHMGGTITGAQQLQSIPQQSILVAIDLIPSELTQLPLDHIQGIALAESTPTAHSAILARTLEIPMACALGDAILRLGQGQAILDGEVGELLFIPSANELTRYRDTQRQQAEERASALEHAAETATTRDNITITVLANINSPDEIAQLHATGADGVGLLRTEYLFQNRLTAPTAEEQFAIYLELAQQMEGHPLTVRALDAGGDKPMQYLNHHHEENPFLGLRGIRLLLHQPTLLRTQFQALYRVAVALEHVLEIRFMLPMVSAVEEVRAARSLLNEIVAEETTAAQPLMMKIGAMIEIPSAALIAQRLAPYVDFFSIGTNDLAQYTLATDRTNASVAALADPLHPAVLQLIKLTCDAAEVAQIPVSICGEISGDPHAVPLLLGLGLTELSAPLPAVPLVKEAVRECTYRTAKLLAQRALGCDDARAVRALLKN
ncbi:MAG TPA: phosphoenolpyruvate--protein phosphotransferase [Caldilineaceae bacterium]|nr:phosphoenolpyruvate--protein phosphotransferase [Caldilineaceae bacterium]